MPTAKSAPPARTIPALSRGLRAVRILATAGESGASFSEMGRLLGNLPAPTLSRLLKALLSEGYAVKTDAGLYARGPELDDLGRALGAGGTLEETALRAMTTFANETGESIGFARFYGDRLVMVEKVEVRDSFKLATIGYSFRPDPAEGPTIAVAAHLAGADFNRFVRSPDNRVTSVTEFRKLAAACRRNGVQVEPMPKRPVRGGPRRACVAVLGPDGRPVGELHTVCPGAHFAKDGRKISACLLRAAETIAERLAAAVGAGPARRGP
ncbi:MAG: helix-turn-helix domain-containing protein [Planctomycetota bacterium]|jgi:DNA-binding IclR family transcriptional regulator